MIKGYYLRKSGDITHKIVGLTSDNQIVIEDLVTSQLDKLSTVDFNGAILLDGYGIVMTWGDDFNGIGTISSNEIGDVLESLGGL